MNENISHIAIGYDESTGYVPDETNLIDELDEFIDQMVDHAGSHNASLMVIEEWPPGGAGALSKMIFDLGLAMYLGKPLIVVYKSGIELPEHIRKLATHCVSYTGDDPTKSTTAQAIMARYA